MMTMLMCPDEDVHELMSGRSPAREEDSCACACAHERQPKALPWELPLLVDDADDIAF